MNEKLKVTYLTLNPPNSGSIIATLGMYLPKIDLYLSKMRLVRKKNGGLYLAYPSDTGILPIQDPTNGQPYEVRKGD